MRTREKAKTGAMKGGVRAPRGKDSGWSFPVYLGNQPAQRCPACTAARKRPNRWWIGAKRLESCPNCGGELRETREPRQVTEGGFATKKDAEQARARAVLRLGRGTYRPPERMTLAEYLRDHWLPEVMASGLKTTTKQGYERCVRFHLIGPAEKPFPIGLMELRKLNREVIRSHYRELMDGYTVDDFERGERSRLVIDRKTHKPIPKLVRRPGLKLSSVQRVQAALHGALAAAVELGMLEHNPATGAIKKNKLGDGDAVPAALKAWTPEELETFLDSQEGTPLYPLWRLLAVTGMRRGEALGLQWGDVDTVDCRVTVRRNRVPVAGGEVVETSTKTDRVRVVDVDRETVDVLKAMRRARSVRRIGAGPEYLFTDDAGLPLHPHAVGYQWQLATAASGVRHIGLHGLRHTHFSQLVGEGQSIPMAAERGGWANPNVLMKTYAHCLPGQQQTAVASMARYRRKASR